MPEHLPLPVASAMVLADHVIVEAGSGKKTLVGVYSNIFARHMPFGRHINLYAEITDALGTYDFDLSLHHLDSDDEVAGTRLAEVESVDRLRPLELVVRMPVNFLDYGTYELRIAHEGRVFANRTFRVQPPPFVAQEDDAHGDGEAPQDGPAPGDGPGDGPGPDGAGL
jgi:hypothetical protein